MKELKRNISGRHRLSKRKKQGFFRIWTAVAIPLILLTLLVLLLGMALLSALQVKMGFSRAKIIAYEISEEIEGRADSFTADAKEQEQFWENVRYDMNGNIFNMVSVLYHPDGTIAAISDIESYRPHSHIGKQIYEDILLTVKNRGRNGKEEISSDIFGYSYLYEGHEIKINNQIYVLQSGAVAAPFVSYKDPFIIIGGSVLLCMILLSLFIAFLFYKIYKERLMMEQHRRDTVNAMAHDLRTPLTVISGYAQNLLEDARSQKRDYYAQAIVRNVGEMNDLVENMLELARTEQTAVALNLESFSMRPLTEQVLEQYAGKIEEKKLLVETKGDVRIIADKKLMKRVVENLIGNAVKYTPMNQRIIIQMNKNQFGITNTGAAIPKEKQRELWKPFIKEDTSRKSGSGTGLGLAIVKEILDSHSFGCELCSHKDSVTVSVYF